MLDCGLLTINDDDPRPKSQQINDMNMDAKCSVFQIETDCLMPQMKKQNEYLENMENNSNKFAIDESPSILKTSLLAGAAATLASITTSETRIEGMATNKKGTVVSNTKTASTAIIQSKRLISTATTIATTIKSNSTSLLQSVLLATDKSKEEEEQQNIPTFKSTMSLTTLSEIASERKKQLELEEQQQQLALLNQKSTITNTILLPLSTATFNSKPATCVQQLLPSKLRTITNSLDVENKLNQYQAISTQTVKIPMKRTATVTTQTQANELLDIRLPTTTSTATSTDTTTAINRHFVSDKLNTTNTTTTLSTARISTITNHQLTAVSLCEEHMTPSPPFASSTEATTIATSPSTPCSPSIVVQGNRLVSCQQHTQQLFVLNPQQHLSTKPTPTTSALLPIPLQTYPHSSLPNQHYQQQQNQLHHQHKHLHQLHQQQQQQQQQQQADFAPTTSSTAVTVVVLKTMLPDD